MPRIEPVNPQQADPATAERLEGVRRKLGVVPNLITTVARSPAALDGYLQFSGALAAGALTARQRELVAIAVAQENSCEYCLSAHATIGKGIGLDEQDVERARRGRARDDLDDAITSFALQVVRQRGRIDDAAIRSARDAGLDDGRIIEIVANVALNVLTNYVNNVADTEVDFPLLKLSSAA